MHFMTDGIVIREKGTGERDRHVTLLTRDYGVLHAFVRGAQSYKSERQSGTQIFAYSDFTVDRGRDAYVVTEARPKKVFYALREDISRLALAQYFCELAAELAPKESPAEEYLSLLLNALHLLTAGKRPQPFLKAVMELRYMSMSGYMPDLLGCAVCRTYSVPDMRLDLHTGRLYCPQCHGRGIPLSLGQLAAVRHICLAEPKKVFSFTLPDPSLQRLAELTEEYARIHLNRPFRTLQFYKSVVFGEQT